MVLLLITLLCSDNRTVRVWSTSNSQEIANFEQKQPVRQICLSQKGRIGIPLSSERETKLWNRIDKCNSANLIEHTEMVNDLAVLNNEKFCLTGSDDETTLDLETEEEVVVFRGHQEKVTRVKLTEDNQHCISGSRDCTIKAWSSAKRMHSKEIKGLGYLAEQLAVTREYLVIP